MGTQLRGLGPSPNPSFWEAVNSPQAHGESPDRAANHEEGAVLFGGLCLRAGGLCFPFDTHLYFPERFSPLRVQAVILPFLPGTWLYHTAFRRNWCWRHRGYEETLKSVRDDQVSRNRCPETDAHIYAQRFLRSTLVHVNWKGTA